MPCHVRKPPMVKKKICQSVNYVPTLKVDILELQPNYILTPNHSRNTLAHILYPFGNSDYVKNLNRKKSWNFITSCTRMNTADITGEDPNNWDARSIRVFIHWLLAILDWNWKSPTSRIFRSWNDNERGKPWKNCKSEEHSQLSISEGISYMCLVAIGHLSTLLVNFVKDTKSLGA